MPQAAPIIEQINEEAKNFNRVYIANILQGITEQDVYLVFEAFGKIKSCTLIQSSVPGKHKGYCFIEYETEQAALDAIVSMNCFDLGGQQIRVGRSITPPNCLETTSPATSSSTLPTASALAAAAITAQITALEATGSSSSLPTLQNNKTASGLSLSTIALAPNTVQPVNAKNVAGVITGVTLNNPSTNHQQTNSLTIPPPTLITNLPLSSVTNSTSTVNGSSSVNNSSSNGLISSSNNNNQKENKLEASSIVDELQSLQQQESMSIKGANARQMLMQKLMRKIESRVIVLKNMVTVDDIDDELESEVTDECGKFGTVNRVIIYQEKQSDDEDAEVIVKIFVEFQQGSCKFRSNSVLFFF